MIELQKHQLLESLRKDRFNGMTYAQIATKHNKPYSYVFKTLKYYKGRAETIARLPERDAKILLESKTISVADLAINYKMTVGHINKIIRVQGGSSPKKPAVKTGQGHAKVTAKDKVFKSKVFNPSDYRKIKMNDSKNTVRFIRLTDPRTDEEVRAEWKDKQERKLKSLAS